MESVDFANGVLIVEDGIVVEVLYRTKDGLCPTCIIDERSGNDVRHIPLSKLMTNNCFNYPYKARKPKR